MGDQFRYFVNATASGAADASSSDVRGLDDKYATRTFDTASGVADASNSAVRELDGKCTTRMINILQLNINGTQRKRDELHSILLENNIHIACLQETKLNNNLTLNIKGYVTIRKDRENRCGGGLAFLIKRNIKYKEIELVSDGNPGSTELQALHIFLPKASFFLFNAYHPDNSEINTELFDTFSNSPSDPIVLLGDFNAKSPTWGSPTIDPKGQQVEDILIDLGLSVINNGQNTYLSRTSGTESALDITAVSYHLAINCNWKILESAMSDHRPIITTLNLCSGPETVQIKRSWNFRKADWENFTLLLDELCSHKPFTSDLNENVKNFINFITTAAKRYIPRGKRKDKWVPYWKDFNIDTLIRERDSLNEKLKTDNTEENRKLLSEATIQVEEAIANGKSIKWAEFCNSLDPKKDSKFWRVAKTLNNCFTGHTNLRSNFVDLSNPSEISNVAIANKLATYYSNTSRLEFHKEDRSVCITVKKLLREARSQESNDPMSDDITMEELDHVISELDPRKSPGCDLVFGYMVKHFGNVAKDFLLKIINTSWKTGKLPNLWKMSIIIPILKPGKTADECKNYRPIALTSILCKITERIIHSRILGALTEQKKLSYYQGAYRKHHSTVDQLFHLCQSIIDGFQGKPPRKTTAVFLDMSSAFDTVWRQKMIIVAHSHGIKGNALIWIADFLRNRNLRVRFDGALSKSRKSWAGVPQGSVLSPLLFLLYVNDIQKHLHEETKIACFADDIAIWHTCNDIDKSALALNQSLKNVLTWSQKLKLKFNPQKSLFTVFTTDRKHRNQFRPTIILDGVPLTQTSSPKYLGVQLDPELRFGEHIKNCGNKALKRLKILKSLCGTNWGANPKTLRTTYTALARPHLEYATPIWAHASATTLNYLDSIQARAAKIICGAVSSTNNGKVMRECGLTSLKNRRKYQTINFTNKIRSRDSDHISRRTFENWSKKTRLKRSSTLQFDSEIRREIGLEHSTLDILEEPSLSKCLPKNTTINTNLIVPCSKKELTSVIFEKGIQTINAMSESNLVHAYTDGSADETIQKGGAGVHIVLPNGIITNHSLGTGSIASNFTSELRAINNALHEYLSLNNTDKADGLVIFCDSKAALEAMNKGQSRLTQDIQHQLKEMDKLNKICIMQWMPAHVGIPGNEEADKLAKEGRNLNVENFIKVTLDDVNAIARFRLRENTIKKDLQICEINANRDLTKTITRLRTGHYREMKIQRDGKRTYRLCNNCDNIPLTPEHIFDCPAFLRSLAQLGEFPPFHFEKLYSENIKEIAGCVLRTHGHL